MKKTFRHVLARVRERLDNLTQRELARYIGCSEHTVQAIELGKLRLPKRLAWRISEAIGVSYDWLLDNDLSQEPINRAGQPYSRADLVIAQEASVAPLGCDPSSDVPKIAAEDKKRRLRKACRTLRLLLEEAQSQPDHKAAFFLAEVERFVRDQQRLFPELGAGSEQRRKRSAKGKRKSAGSHASRLLAVALCQATGFWWLELSAHLGGQLAFETGRCHKAGNLWTA